MHPRPLRHLLLALLADATGIVAFAALGRRSHDEADGVGAVLSTAAPFLVALALGWALAGLLGGRSPLARSWPRLGDPLDPDAGTVIWLVTVAGGLLLRRTLWDRGTALPFVVVATLFCGFVLVGWRIGYDRMRRRRAGS